MSYPPSGLPASDMRIGVGFEGASEDRADKPVKRLTSSLSPENLPPKDRAKYKRMITKAKICNAVAVLLLLGMAAFLATSLVLNFRILKTGLMLLVATKIVLGVLSLGCDYKVDAHKILNNQRACS